MVQEKERDKIGTRERERERERKKIGTRERERRKSCTV